MNVAAPPALRPEDFPEVDANLLAAITRALRSQFDALASVPAFGFKEGLRFTSGVGGTAYLDVTVDPAPRHAWVSWLGASDGSELTLVYSQTCVRMRGGVRFLFVGLSASTEYVCSVVFV